MVCQELVYTVYVLPASKSFPLYGDASSIPNSNFFIHPQKKIFYLLQIKRGLMFFKSTKMKQWSESIF